MRVHDWTKVSAGDFHDFHQVWTAQLRSHLNNGILPAAYYAQVEQVAGNIVPDVLTLHEGDFADSEPSGDTAGALALATAPPKVEEIAEIERQAYLSRKNKVVIHHASSRRVVAIIELVSSGNKASVREWKRFVDKAVAALEQEIHLLIVDLYPPTPRDPQGVHGSIWAELGGPEYVPRAGKELTQVAYQAGETERAFIETLAVGDELSSTMPLFLSGGLYVNAPLPETYELAFQGAPRPIRRKLEESLP